MQAIRAKTNLQDSANRMETDHRRQHTLFVSETVGEAVHLLANQSAVLYWIGRARGCCWG